MNGKMAGLTKGKKTEELQKMFQCHDCLCPDGMRHVEMTDRVPPISTNV